VVRLKRIKIEAEGKIYRTSDGISVPRNHDFRIRVRHGEKIINAINQQELQEDTFVNKCQQTKHCESTTLFKKPHSITEETCG